MIDATNYLDLGNLLFNELIGDVMLALFVGYIIIGIVGANNRFTWQVMALHALLWTCIVFAFSTGLIVLWAFAALIAGVSFFYPLSKLIGRAG